MKDEFDAYLSQESYVRNSLSDHGMVHPIAHLSNMLNQNEEIRRIVTKGVGGVKDKDGVFFPVKDEHRAALRGTLMYALLGGDKHFKGLTLTPSKFQNNFDLESVKAFSSQAKTIIEQRPSDGKSAAWRKSLFNCGVKGG